MFLIDKPFVSDFLIETIKDNNYKIIAKSSQRMVKDDSLAWIAEEEAIALLKKISLYSNSENALAWIDQYYGESELSGQLQV
jgi:TnpA family transposase